jgi:hypothetical protein
MVRIHHTRLIFILYGLAAWKLLACNHTGVYAPVDERIAPTVAEAGVGHCNTDSKVIHYGKGP